MIVVGEHFENFEAARLYYLHDKRITGEDDRFTDERIARAETRNLPTEDPHKGFKVMSFTAMHANDIKRAAGNRPGPLPKKPGFSLMLSWHAEDGPSPEHMIAQGDEVLRLLKLDDRQAVPIIHDDKDHRHLHVLVNLVHPETGKVQHPEPNPKTGKPEHELTNYKLKLSQWAEAYEEREYGPNRPIRVPGRIEANQKRQDGLNVKNPRIPRQEYERFQDIIKSRRSPEEIRTIRSAEQLAERTAYLRRTRDQHRQNLRALHQRYAGELTDVSRRIRATEARLEHQGFFYSLWRKLTNADVRDFRALDALNSERERLQQNYAAALDATRRERVDGYLSLRRIHHRQRARDEDAIELMLERARAAGRASAGGRKHFKTAAPDQNAPTQDDTQKPKRKRTPRPRKSPAQDQSDEFPHLSGRERIRAQAAKIGAERGEDSGPDTDRDNDLDQEHEP